MRIRSVFAGTSENYQIMLYNELFVYIMLVYVWWYIYVRGREQDHWCINGYMQLCLIFYSSSIFVVWSSNPSKTGLIWTKRNKGHVLFDAPCVNNDPCSNWTLVICHKYLQIFNRKKQWYSCTCDDLMNFSHLGMATRAYQQPPTFFPKI